MLVRRKFTILLLSGCVLTTSTDLRPTNSLGGRESRIEKLSASSRRSLKGVMASVPDAPKMLEEVGVDAVLSQRWEAGSKGVPQLNCDAWRRIVTYTHRYGC